MGFRMAMLFRADSLQVTDDWIRSAAGTFAIRDVRSVWVTRRQVTGGSRLLTAALGIGAILVVVGGAGATGWLTRNWMWLLAAPVIFLVAAWIGLLDPIAIYLEKRHHELWIATDVVAVRVWKANSVEAKKALRQIQRARERHHEQNEV
jgi:hypothetical protein